MSDTEPTPGTLFGTPVDFFPLPTPYPSLAGCEEGIYRQVNDGTILAWDPVYTRFEPGANACFPPVQRSWWDQPSDADPSTALGPTFVCPEAYHAVHTTVLESNSASQAHYTYCCPKTDPPLLTPTSTTRLGSGCSVPGQPEAVGYGTSYKA
ncbi:predicted protein [Chaetomium globosum CBS 148.51]|uniref:Uncharacterized protein n=1 Tax=Chaetomium globosum (strain ATCC 6205 / CBS 148.51 / DSM 1962 / NBRC 6347 / NRRL 1970) TaxID=306901 RepID=Q2H531_CHAGB|nr:uncharacterized protein CHGG_06234 [Chaetomium globosum CBS 148.51]EAQ89615.1 predicted protein [Chaetomium globosum CBS 148.51]